MKNVYYQKSIGLLTSLAGICLASCTGVSGTANKSEDSIPNVTAASDSLYFGKNSFSYTAGGHTFAIKDNLKLGEGKYTGALHLNSVKDEPENNMIRIKCTNLITSEVFNFYVHEKGTTNIIHSKASFADVVNGKEAIATYMAPHYGSNFYGDSVSITIAAGLNTRVSGTFSGSFLTDDHKSAVEITNGSFDLAFSKAGSNR